MTSMHNQTPKERLQLWTVPNRRFKTLNTGRCKTQAGQHRDPNKSKHNSSNQADEMKQNKGNEDPITSLSPISQTRPIQQNQNNTLLHNQLATWHNHIYLIPNRAIPTDYKK